MSEYLKNKHNNFIEESKINKFFDLKEQKVGNASIVFNNNNFKAKYYYGETEEEKQKRKNIKNINQKLNNF